MAAVGCVTFAARVIDGAGRLVCDLDGVQTVQWQRLLDEVSAAEVLVGAGGDCCECLSEVRSWAHRLVIYDDDGPVWSGPVVRVEWGSAATRIYARDVSAWLARRVLDVDLGFVDVDLIDIAAGLAEAGLDQQRPAGVAVEAPQGLSGIRDTRTYGAADGTVLDLLRELAGAGLDWTAHGGRILLLPEDAACSVVAGLTDADFPDGITVVEDGLSLCTGATVLGDGVVGRATGDTSYYGLVECFADTDGVVTQAGADGAAASLVASATPAPVFVQVGPGARMSSSADTDLSVLVPGWCVTVRAAETCRPVVSTMRLTELTVAEEPSGVTVSVTLAPPGLQAGGSL